MKEMMMLSLVVYLCCLLCSCAAESNGEPLNPPADNPGEINLPVPKTDGRISLEQTLLKRRSVRKYAQKELTLEQISQLCWAAQGITARRGRIGFRTAPSAGALYPMSLYLLKKDGYYKYIPETHSLKLISKENLLEDLTEAALGQPYIKKAPVTFVISGDYAKCAKRYRDRAPLFVHVETGHIGQNIHLQAVALGLGSVPIGAFRDEDVKDVLGLPDNEAPLYIIPVGYPE